MILYTKYIILEPKGRYQSGQLDLAVNQTAYAFGGSNPSLPTKFKTNASLEVLVLNLLTKEKDSNRQQ